MASAEPLHAPLDLIPGQPAAVARPAPTSAGLAADLGSGGPVPAAVPGQGSIASLAPGSTRSEYEADFGLYKSGQFDAAATAFTAFLVKYPRDRLVPDATYFLGESYARLGRHREAAEQFLRMTTDYTRSTRAPDALLRLGIALNALGAKEQACATYQEVDRKFPTASPDVRTGVERELKRARC
jgi:tol-pal system protein YbgF